MEKIEDGIIQNAEFRLIDEIMGEIPKETATEVINIRCVINGRIAKTFFNAIREVSSEFTLIFGEDGIKYCNLDDGKLSGSDGRIILTNALLHKDDLFEYDVNGVYEFGINTDALFFVGGSTIIGDVTITSDNKDKLKFVLDESSYTVKSIEIEKSEINLTSLNNTDYTIKEEFSLETITKILKSANSLKSETVQFIVKDSKIICKIETEIAEAEHKLSDISDNNEEFNLTFATSYLSVIPKYQKFFLKATRKDNQILIFLKGSTPVKFRVNIEFESYIQCYLAPRIEENDDDEDYCNECDDWKCNCDCDKKDDNEEKKSGDEFKEEIKETMEKSKDLDKMNDDEKMDYILENEKHHRDCECNTCNEEYYSRENQKDDELDEEH